MPIHTHLAHPCDVSDVLHITYHIHSATRLRLIHQLHANNHALYARAHAWVPSSSSRTKLRVVVLIMQ
jgi:hypothetical protein